MLEVTDLFKAACKERATRSALRIRFFPNTIAGADPSLGVTITPDEIITGSPTVELTGMSSNSLSLGDVCSGVFKFTITKACLDRIVDTLEIPSGLNYLKGMEVIPLLYYKVDDEEQRDDLIWFNKDGSLNETGLCSFQSFYIKNIRGTDTTIFFECYDKMYNLDTKIDDEVYEMIESGVYTLRDMLAYISEKFEFSDYIISPTSTNATFFLIGDIKGKNITTYRDLLSSLAYVLGSFATITRGNTLKLVPVVGEYQYMSSEMIKEQWFEVREPFDEVITDEITKSYEIGVAPAVVTTFKTKVGDTEYTFVDEVATTNMININVEVKENSLLAAIAETDTPQSMMIPTAMLNLAYMFGATLGDYSKPKLMTAKLEINCLPYIEPGDTLIFIRKTVTSDGEIEYKSAGYGIVANKVYHRLGVSTEIDCVSDESTTAQIHTSTSGGSISPSGGGGGTGGEDSRVTQLISATGYPQEEVRTLTIELPTDIYYTKESLGNADITPNERNVSFRYLLPDLRDYVEQEILDNATEIKVEVDFTGLTIDYTTAFVTYKFEYEGDTYESARIYDKDLILTNTPYNLSPADAEPLEGSITGKNSATFSISCEFNTTDVFSRSLESDGVTLPTTYTYDILKRAEGELTLKGEDIDIWRKITVDIGIRDKDHSNYFHRCSNVSSEYEGLAIEPQPNQYGNYIVYTETFNITDDEDAFIRIKNGDYNLHTAVDYYSSTEETYATMASQCKITKSPYKPSEVTNENLSYVFTALAGYIGDEVYWGDYTPGSPVYWVFADGVGTAMKTEDNEMCVFSLLGGLRDIGSDQIPIGDISLSTNVLDFVEIKTRGTVKNLPKAKYTITYTETRGASIDVVADRVMTTEENKSAIVDVKTTGVLDNNEVLAMQRDIAELNRVSEILRKQVAHLEQWIR